MVESLETDGCLGPNPTSTTYCVSDLGWVSFWFTCLKIGMRVIIPKCHMGRIWAEWILLAPLRFWVCNPRKITQKRAPGKISCQPTKHRFRLYHWYLTRIMWPETYLGTWCHIFREMPSAEYLVCIISFQTHNTTMKSIQASALSDRWKNWGLRGQELAQDDLLIRKWYRWWQLPDAGAQGLGPHTGWHS